MPELQDTEKAMTGGGTTSADEIYSAHSSTSEEVVVSSAVEKALIRKLDLHLIPIIMLLYLFSFLDRGMMNHLAPTLATF
jgi:hypothetical protein